MKIQNTQQKNMMKKFFFLALAVGIIFFSLNLITAANACCEKTLSGAWCQNAPQADCDTNYKSSPTSCDSTSYCKAGCCFDTQEGLCMENTAQRICAASNATWANDSNCNIPQCNLGCCILADQGAFVTLARCRALSGFYALKTDFRNNIADEISCIATAQGSDKGACVFDDPATFQKTCTFTSRINCPTASYSTSNLSLVNSSNTTASIGFYKDTLCTAEELGTNCAPSTKTMMINGKDEVYFQDTCGQPGNIYDATRYTDKQYWKKVYKKSESCGYGSSNAKSASCGNCDYYLGSIAKKATRSTGLPTYGDYICADLGCVTNDGKKKQHGESWCVTDSPSGDGQDPAGSRYYKAVCLFNEILSEPCADFRQEVCIEDEFNGFTEAACRVNRWQDCTSQLQESDCTNYGERDCKWIEGYYFSSSNQQVEKTNNDSKKGPITPTGLCVPNYPPGSVFWSSSKTTSKSTTNSSLGTGYVTPSSSSSASSQCSLGNSKITFKWVKSVKPLAFWEKTPAWTCDQDTGNCQYMTSDDEKNAQISDETAQTWANDMNEICYQIGDCGGYINWVGKYTDDGYAAYKNNLRVAGSGGAQVIQTTKTASSSTGTSTGTSRPTGTQTTSSGTQTSFGTNTPSTGSSGTGSIIPSINGNVIKDMLKSMFGGK